MCFFVKNGTSFNQCSACFFLRNLKYAVQLITWPYVIGMVYVGHDSDQLSGLIVMVYRFKTLTIDESQLTVLLNPT